MIVLQTFHGPSEKLVKIYGTDFAELKKVNSRIYSNCSNYSSFLFKSYKFSCFSFCL